MSHIISAAQVNLFSVLVLGIIFIYSVQKRYTFTILNKIYMACLLAAIFTLILDFLGRLDGIPGELPILLNNVCNFIIFLFASVVPSLWFLYAYNFILKPKKQSRSFITALLSVNVLYILTIIVTQSRELMFYVDQDNYYHRGPLYAISVIASLLILFAAQAMIFINRRKIDRKHYAVLWFFAGPPLAAAVIQAFIPGFSFVLNAFAFSLFTVFLYTQDLTIHLDYLSEVYNRRYFETALIKKIKHAKSKK
ncbi:MAG: histidine kinase N-terminal 7TM domain-containing protein, partial [Eubacteriales bacterium]